MRYNSFSSQDDFRKEILAKNPTRFEIGPVYNYRVSARKEVSVEEMWKGQRIGARRNGMAGSRLERRLIGQGSRPLIGHLCSSTHHSY